MKQPKLFADIPWCSILTSASVWALTGAKIGHDWLFYCLIIYMLKYLRDELKLPNIQVARYSTIPYLLLFVLSLSSAALGDYLITRKILTVTQSRKIFTAIGI